MTSELLWLLAGPARSRCEVGETYLLLERTEDSDITGADGGQLHWVNVGVICSFPCYSL